MVSASLDMLEESLVKKIEVMNKIQEQNDIQKQLLNDKEELDLQKFDKIVEIKGNLIEELLKLDDGFQTLFDKVKKEVGDNKELYKDQIRRMQQQIQEITSLSASIEAEEHRNKKLAEEYFSEARKKMNYGRKTSAAAFNYYRTMNNFKDIPPQFMDNKK